MSGRRPSCRHRRTGFDKLDASLAKAVMSIGAVKSVEIGDGIEVSRSLGSENNDAFFLEENDSPSLREACERAATIAAVFLGGDE